MENLLVIIKALTPLHVGSGKEESAYVDLPIQRDEFDFPTIWASSLKGALRANYNQNDKNSIFGPEPESEVTQSSAVSFLDARLFLIPARTFTNIWTYMTSPHMLERVNVYLSLIGKSIDVPDVSNKVLVDRTSLLTNNRIILNETELDAQVDDKVKKILMQDVLPQDIFNLVSKRGLVIVPDSNSLSKTLVNKSLLIQYRIRLDKDKKTVVSGALWSEEYVPADSIFISLVVCKKNEKQVCDKLNGYLNNLTISIGGKETIGKGLVKIYTMRGKHGQ